MSICATCGNEMIMCICPKGLGGGQEKGLMSVEDDAYNEAVHQVAIAILKQYADIHDKNSNQLAAFIDIFRAILDDESAENLLELLEDGITYDKDVATFKKAFQGLNPNMAMLDALSHQFNLNVFPSPANQLVTGIQQALQLLEG